MTMARNVRNVIDEIDELREKTALYEELQAYLGKHVKEDTTDFKLADGGFVSADAVNDLMTEFDGVLEGFKKRVKGLESSEVRDGKGEPGEAGRRDRKKAR